MKKILSFVCFVCLAFGMYVGLSYLMADRETTFAAVYSEPDNSVDVLIVGSSHVTSGYIPNMLWEQNNLSAVNAFSWHQPMWVSYHYIVEALKTQQPKIIVLEMYGLLYDRTEYNNSFNLDMGLNRLQLMATSKYIGSDLRNPADFLYLPRYHTRWKDFDLKEFLEYDAHNRHDYLKGYGYLTNAIGAAGPNRPVSEEITVPYEYGVEYLEKIVALCEENNIDLIFTLAPYIYGTLDTQIFNWAEDFARQKNIPFLNYMYGENFRDIKFDYAKDLADAGHCNYYGAVKLTQDLCDYLNETGRARRSKDSHPYREMLDTDYAKFARVPTVTQPMSHTNMTAWLAACAADRDVSLFVNSHNADSATIGMISGIFGEKGFNGDKYFIHTTQETVQNGSMYDFSLFENPGKVEFAADSNDIYLNGCAVPGEEAMLKVVMYDNVLGRPVMSVWGNKNEFNTREFTSDIMENYK